MLSVLRETLQLAESLHASLEREQQALYDNDLESIEQIAAAKAELAASIEALERRRAELVSQAGFPTHANGMAAYLGHLEQGPEGTRTVTAQWQTLQGVLRQCDRQNQINGIMLEKNRRRAEALLRLLRGDADTPQLYSEAGKAVSDKRGQHLAQA